MDNTTFPAVVDLCLGTEIPELDLFPDAVSASGCFGCASSESTLSCPAACFSTAGTASTGG